MVHKSVVESRMLTALKDTIELLRESMADTGETRSSHTVTQKQLNNAVDALVILLDLPPVDAMEWAALFVELKGRAQTIDDMAQALAQEQGDPQTSELRVWAAAVRACVESHARDMEIVNPWARLQPKQASDLVESLTRQVPEWTSLYTNVRKMPTLEGASEYFESALSEFAVIYERLLRDPSENVDLLAGHQGVNKAIFPCAPVSAAPSPPPFP